MKALGIIRKFDDLGRLVIPKEIRRSKGWEAGTPMEMFATKEGLVIREYGVSFEQNALTELLEEMLENESNEETKDVYERAIKFIGKG